MPKQPNHCVQNSGSKLSNNTLVEAKRSEHSVHTKTPQETKRHVFWDLSELPKSTTYHDVVTLHL